jgi:hypothetical protein
MTNGRNAAGMQQDIRLVQGSIRQVAGATGGRIIRRSGDLAAALAGVVEDGSLRVLPVDENTGRMGSVTIPAPALAGSQ